MLPRLKVPFPCTGNSYRSRMAEARPRVHGAGLEASELHPVALEGSLETRLEEFRKGRDAIERRVLDRLRTPGPGRIGARR